MYRALYDLRRGWRVILPNLEQCALLEIEYKNLKENCEADESWKLIPFINSIPSRERLEIIYQVLEFFRKSYALYSEESLTPKAIDKEQRDNRKTESTLETRG